MKSGEIELGDEVKDGVTGYQGVAVARTEWLHGCIRFNVQPQKLDKDGKIQQMEAFDELQLTLVKKKKVQTGPRETGGPREITRQRSAEKR